MLTIFSTGKPFRGHCGMIQRNAIKSWTLLHPDVEVMLFGDEEGALETATELGIRYIPQVARTPEGTKVLRSFFDPAQRMARHDALCYVNSDIILTPDFITAVTTVREACRSFLVVGRRWDTDIDKEIAFDRPDWADRIRALALEKGQQCSAGWIDYFVFPRGLYLDQLPSFVIGRVFWDQWLVWRARHSGVPVVDASEAVLAIHQNHDYHYHPAGKSGVWTDELARRNFDLAGGRWHLCTMDDATHTLGSRGFSPNPGRHLQMVKRFLRNVRETLWLGALRWTRPFRHAIGLRKGS